MDHPIRLADQLRAHLRALRRERGLTQAELGLRLGLGQVRIADIEAKPGLISVDQLVAILSALGATLVVREPDRDAGIGAAPKRRKPLEPPPAAPRARTTATRAKKGSW